MPAPKDYKKVTHSFEPYGNNDKVVYRNGEPVFVLMECPDKDHEAANVMVLSKVKKLESSDAISALLSMLLSGR